MRRENEVIQKIHALAGFSTPSLQFMLPSAPALDIDRDREQKPSAKTPLRLGDRRHGA